MELVHPFDEVVTRRQAWLAGRRVLVVGKHLAARLKPRLSRLDVREDVLVDRSRAAPHHSELMLSRASVELDEREPAGVADAPTAVAEGIRETHRVSDVDEPHGSTIQCLGNA